MHSLTIKIEYYNAIVYCSEKEGRLQQHFLKFHSIKNNQHRVGKFLDFVKNKFPSAQHVNFYDKANRQFVERIYLS
jgi:hypothetical protein